MRRESANFIGPAADVSAEMRPDTLLHPSLSTLGCRKLRKRGAFIHPMDDVGVVLLDVTVARAILLCAVAIAVFRARRREVSSDLPGGSTRRF